MPKIEGFSNICSYPSTGNYCQIGGLAFGSEILFGGKLARIGLGYSYLPLSGGTVKISDTVNMNITSSYLPVMAVFRLDFRYVFFGFASGYAIILERPRTFGTSVDTAAGPIGVYSAGLEIGFKVQASETVAIFSSIKSYALISSSTTYVLTPVAGVQMRFE